jgi:Vitamin K-dependent gamma-carboxylase
MSEQVVGTQPWLPGALGRSPWWTVPVPAERLAALRIGLAAVLLLDVLALYLPRASDFFGPDSLAGLNGAGVSWPHWTGWFLGGSEGPTFFFGLVLAWAVAAALLLVGCWSRASAAVAWALALLFASRNPHVHNAGDTIRTTILFYLMLCPCGAAWSVDAWKRGETARLFVPPWPLRLLFVQLALIYFYNGVHKLLGPQWRAGHTLHYVLGDLALSRISYAELPAPYLAIQCLTWLVLAWELTFPLLVLWRPTRTAVLLLGAAFHVGIGLTMELGVFAPYVLCLYLPLLPWERLAADSKG